MPHLVAMYRSPSYSPLQHRVNDTAILDLTAARFAARGWRVTKTAELDVRERALPLPRAELYLNMCQGAAASERLIPLEWSGAVIVNRPSSVLACHRRRLVERLGRGAVAFPRTILVPSASPRIAPHELQDTRRDHQPIWVKRGDVHAERPDDVVAVAAEDLPAAVAAFAARGIPWVALQEHVPGPIVKFYAVTDGRFFHWYGAGNGARAEPFPVDEDRLRALAFRAAALLGLDVFGGDVAFPRWDSPVLIDINDWPSFAPVRQEAAEAIAAYVHERIQARKLA